jgi:hypothetical protein
MREAYGSQPPKGVDARRFGRAPSAASNPPRRNEPRVRCAPFQFISIQQLAVQYHFDCPPSKG